MPITVILDEMTTFIIKGKTIGFLEVILFDEFLDKNWNKNNNIF